MTNIIKTSSALLLLVGSFGLFACDKTDDPTGSQSGAIQGSGLSCTVDSDCLAGEECDDSVCQLHSGGTEDGAGGDDAAGDDNGAGGDDAAGDDNGAGGNDDPAAGGAVCVTDADCAAGQECDNGACKDHGGGGA